jgi:hypothetical protein
MSLVGRVNKRRAPHVKRWPASRIKALFRNNILLACDLKAERPKDDREPSENIRGFSCRKRVAWSKWKSMS